MRHYSDIVFDHLIAAQKTTLSIKALNEGMRNEKWFDRNKQIILYLSEGISIIAGWMKEDLKERMPDES